MPIDYNEEFEAPIAPLCKQIAEEETPPPGGLLSAELWRQRREEELRQILYNRPTQEQVERGMQLLSDYLPQLLPLEQLEVVRGECAAAANAFKDIYTPTSDKTTETLRELLGLSEISIEAFYEVGKYLYEQQWHGEAASVFFVCVMLDPLLVDFWCALGLAYQGEGDLAKAQEALVQAHELLPEDPIALLHLANCYLQRGERGEARNALQTAGELLKLYPQDVEWEGYFESLRCRVA